MRQHHIYRRTQVSAYLPHFADSLRQRGHDRPRCTSVAARELALRLGARTPAWINRHATKLPRTSPLTEFCSDCLSVSSPARAIRSGNMRSRVGLAPLRSRTSQPEGCFYQEKYPWPITTDRERSLAQCARDSCARLTPRKTADAGGISGSGRVDPESMEPRPTPPSENLVGERAPDNRRVIG